VYELFEHTADLGLRVVAPDLDTLFCEAAEGLFAMIVEREPVLGPTERLDFRITGERLDWLLFDWLNELLYVFESRRLLLDDFAAKIGERGVVASARAHPFVPDKDRGLHEIKAITYHGLVIRQSPDGGWIAEVIVDI
jgi:SHS2 domain-containing protein